MKGLQNLLKNNRKWASEISKEDPGFFPRLSKQRPEYLWIGCSDSRIPANQLAGLLPGEMFVHRNVANVVVHSDLNCLSVLQYAVEVLQVKHIIVCGHYGCMGVRVALDGGKLGLIDNWLRHIQDVHHHHISSFTGLKKAQQWDMLCELNVLEQAINVARTTIVQDAWKKKRELIVHAWIYDIKDGLLKDLGVSFNKDDDIDKSYRKAVELVVA